MFTFFRYKQICFTKGNDRIWYKPTWNHQNRGYSTSGTIISFSFNLIRFMKENIVLPIDWFMLFFVGIRPWIKHWCFDDPLSNGFKQICLPKRNDWIWPATMGSRICLTITPIKIMLRYSIRRSVGKTESPKEWFGFNLVQTGLMIALLDLLKMLLMAKFRFASQAGMTGFGTARLQTYEGWVSFSYLRLNVCRILIKTPNSAEGGELPYEDMKKSEVRQKSKKDKMVQNLNTKRL